MVLEFAPEEAAYFTSMISRLLLGATHCVLSYETQPFLPSTGVRSSARCCSKRSEGRRPHRHHFRLSRPMRPPFRKSSTVLQRRSRESLRLQLLSCHDGTPVHTAPTSLAEASRSASPIHKGSLSRGSTSGERTSITPLSSSRSTCSAGPQRNTRRRRELASPPCSHTSNHRKRRNRHTWLHHPANRSQESDNAREAIEESRGKDDRNAQPRVGARLGWLPWLQTPPSYLHQRSLSIKLVRPHPLSISCPHSHRLCPSLSRSAFIFCHSTIMADQPDLGLMTQSFRNITNQVELLANLPAVHNLQ